MSIYLKVELTPTTIFLPSLNNSFTIVSLSVSQTDPFNVRYHYRMVSLPIGLQFEEEVAGGWNWYMAGGVAANLLLQSSVETTRTDVASVSYELKDNSPFRRTQFSGNIGLGVSKQVSDAVTVALGPEYRIFLNPMLSEPDETLTIQGRPYSIGLNMSVHYKLGNTMK